MKIIVDTREKPKAIVKILEAFNAEQIEVIHNKLDVGDYMNPKRPEIVVDRKQSLLEVCNNCCQDLPRFRRELQRARSSGTKLVILVEHGGRIKKLSDVAFWTNPRLKTSPLAMSGDRLFRVMSMLSYSYGIDWRFCTKAQTGKEIIKILKGETDAKP